MSALLLLATLGYPKLFFQYSELYDKVACQNSPLESAWSREARSRESEFMALWEASAPQLVGALFQRFPYPFSRRELSATLSACPTQSSYSQPLVLAVGRFLKSFMGETPVRPGHAFVDMVFHELLHTWVVEHLSPSSSLLLKYKDEPQLVRNHLHLMAIQKYVYQKTDRKDLLGWMDGSYRRTGGAYLRAWEIVIQEGEEVFLAEFNKN